MTGEDLFVNVIIFQVKAHIYAVEADAVREVIDPVTVTPLPFVSAEVEGLVNVAGRVMPQICAVRRLQLDEVAQPGEGVLMLLTSGDHYCALRVSRVITRATIEQGDVSFTSLPEGSNRDALLIGELLWNETLVLLLDPARLLPEQLLEEPGQGDGLGLVSETAGDKARTQAISHISQFPAVVFSCNGEQFAFRFEHVAEVLESGAVTPVPGAPPEMPGVFLLRGTPLPLISMRSLLFGGTGLPTPYTLVVVLNGFRVGLLVERVSGIQRFDSDSLHPLSEERSLLEGFVTTPDNRLVAIIRLAALAAPERFDAWRAWLIPDSAQAGGPQGQQMNAVHRRRLLLFSTGGELLALPLESVDRVEEYSPPTETPGDGSETVCGVIQVQGDIIPVRTLERLMRLGAPTRAGAYLIVSGGGLKLALPVERVERVLDMNESEIEPAAAGRDGILCGVGKYHGRLVSLLNSERLSP